MESKAKMIDWLAIPSGTRAKAVGMWHGATNVVMVALFIVSWLLRAEAHEVAEGKTHKSDGAASSEVSGSRRTT